MREFILKAFTEDEAEACMQHNIQELVRCKDCKNSEHWYRDKRRCFLWAESGIDVFDDGFCNYGEHSKVT